MHEKHLEAKITEALESYPQAELPPNFINHVMARVSPVPQPEKQAFAIENGNSFLPAALGVFAVVFIAVVVWVSHLILEQLNPLMIAYYRNLLHYWRMRLTLIEFPSTSIYLIASVLVATLYGAIYLLTDPRRESR